MLTRRLLPTAVLAALALSVAPAVAGAATEAQDDIADAPALTSVGHWVTYDTDGAGTEAGEPEHVANAGKSVWLKWTPAASGGMRLTACNGKAQGVHIRIYKQKTKGVDSVKNLAPLPAAEQRSFGCDGGSQIIAAQANQTYYIVMVRNLLTVGTQPDAGVFISQQTQAPVITFPNAPKAIGPGGVTIDFDSAPAAKSYTCKLNGDTKTCAGGSFSGLFAKSGEFVLEVTGTDEYLNTGTASWSFTVDADAPQTVIDSAPPTSGASAPLLFHASADSGVTFKCQYDAVVKDPCTSGWKTPAALPGQHTIKVTATDKFGNADPTPAVQTFAVVQPVAPQQPAQPQQPAKPQGGQPQSPAAQAPQPASVQPQGQPEPAQEQPQQAVPQAQQQAPQPQTRPACRVTFAHGRVTKRGISVRVKGDPARACTVSLKLVKGKRVLARSKRTIAAGSRRKLVLRPRAALKSARGVKLVKAAA